MLAEYFPLDLRTKDVRCGVRINVSALLIFVSIMLRPTQAEGEFENVRFIPSYFVHANIYLSVLSSQTLPHNRVEFVVGPSLQPLLLVHVFFRVLLFSSLHKNQHFKIPI